MSQRRKRRHTDPESRPEEPTLLLFGTIQGEPPYGDMSQSIVVRLPLSMVRARMVKTHPHDMPAVSRARAAGWLEDGVQVEDE